MSIFTKIINREISADIVYEQDDIIVIKDINPRAKTHLLIIPKIFISTNLTISLTIDKNCSNNTLRVTLSIILRISGGQMRTWILIDLTISQTLLKSIINNAGVAEPGQRRWT